MSADFAHELKAHDFGEAPVDLLRRAAGLMRERAEAADDGHAWIAAGSYVDTDPECGFNAGTSLLSEHIASWHPAVALAVADWLNLMAWQRQTFAGNMSPFLLDHERRALAIATAYLGSDDA